jgi:hypothetical protein
MIALLDANALIALLWPTHEHHAAMRQWFRLHADAGWASTARGGSVGLGRPSADFHPGLERLRIWKP